MKSSRNTAWPILVFLGVLLLATIAFAEEKPVATVGAVPVTVYELQREQQRLLPLSVSFHGGLSQEKLEEIQKTALDAALDRAYKVNYALANKLEIDKSLVEKEFDAIKKKYKTKKEYKEALGTEGEKAFKKSLQNRFLAEKAEKVAVDDQVQVADADVKKYYEDNKATYKRPRQFKASHILVKVDPASNKEEKEAMYKKAEALAARAKAGEDFYDLAYYNSDDRSKYVGGDLGYFHEGQTVKEFEDALLAMKPGESSSPIKTMFGYHIIKLVERNEPKQLEFDEVKDKIRANMEKKQREQLYQAWMDGLKKQYPVQR